MASIRKMKREAQRKQGAENPNATPSFEITKKDKAYISGLMKLLHSPQTSGDIVGILKTAEPEKSVPQAALTVSDNFKNMSEERGKKIPFETSLKGLTVVTQELFAIGEAAGIFEMPQEKGVAIMQETMQTFVHQGLKDKSIDPIELQMYGESLMTPEQKAMGLQAGQQAGVPQEPGVEQAMETYAGQRERSAMDKVANKQAAQNRQGAMAQAQQAQMQQGGA